eukprot:CAMPEP_0198141778 /NCGR_PEP_ID=MMETSP1443-20131203/4718_1 /TAXON_ID=186043 /ORGANISM="Entomoneis sp., Strain CCMP2396" /LENGTH=522 /DNA_ID=CAMNT_0043804617 /DNA_START=143 /DNA_END=1711 /DNA_ORIENTATION=-
MVLPWSRALMVGVLLTFNAPFLLMIFLDREPSTACANNYGTPLFHNDAAISSGDGRKVPDSTGTSACLYIMDDNHYLIEWMAYHYHAANLRHLIITTDPDSLTSPQHILDRWKGRMEIELWNDTHFLPPNAEFEEVVEDRMFGGKANKERQAYTLQTHRARQDLFNLECLRQHKRKDRGWVLMIDTDEYMTLSPDMRYELGVSMEQPNVVDMVLKQIILPDPYYKHLTTPCVPIHRRQFSARERENTDKQVNSMVPAGFDGNNFQTLRWIRYGWKTVEYQTRLKDYKCYSNAEIPGKVIIDLGRLRLQDMNHPNNTGDVHQPLESICNKNLYFHTTETPFVVNHYLGTLAQWQYRAGDKRGQGFRLAKYQFLNSRNGLKSTDQLIPWLRGFVSSLGEEEAKILLAGVGILEPLPQRQEEPVQKQVNLSLQDTEVYKVGDIVQENYEGAGDWSWAEVSAVYPNGYYNVCYFPDCDEFVATFGARMRRTGEVVFEVEDEKEFEGVDLKKLEKEISELAQKLPRG